MDAEFFKNTKYFREHTYSLLVMHLNLEEKRVDIIPIGKYMDMLKIKPFFTSRVGFPLADEPKTSTPTPTTVNSNTTADPNDELINNMHNLDEEEQKQIKFIKLNMNNQSSSVSFKVSWRFYLDQL